MVIGRLAAIALRNALFKLHLKGTEPTRLFNDVHLSLNYQGTGSADVLLPDDVSEKIMRVPEISASFNVKRTGLILF